MNIYLIFLVISITIAQTQSLRKVKPTKCTHIDIWGCSKSKKLAFARHRKSSSRSETGEVQIDLTRDDTSKGCAFGDRSCRKQMLRELQKNKRKRQMDCPFGVWGCKKTIVVNDTSKKPCRRGERGCSAGRQHAREVDSDVDDDLIEKLFAESRMAPQ